MSDELVRRGDPIVEVRRPGGIPLAVVIRADAVEIGRDCGGLVVEDAQVSRCHLELRRVPAGVLVVDRGSTNGTTVDGHRLHEPHLLAAGQTVRLGSTTITLLASTASRDVLDTPRAGATTSIDLVAAAAAADPPDVASLATESGTLTIVFSDIENSTRRAREVGDDRWIELLSTHNAVVRRQVARHGGTEIKAQGDGFMLTFASARSAIACMIDVQQALETLARSRPGDALRVRVGIHTGEAIVGDGGDLFGHHVNLAARVGSAAVGGEILVSSVVREMVEPRGGFRFGPARRVALKGLGDGHVVVPIEWRTVTTMPA